MTKKLLSSCSIAIACVLLVMIQPAFATIIDFTVPGREEVTQTINLEVDDHVVIRFSVVGGENGSTLDFFIICPNGTVTMAYPGSAGASCAFVCESNGNYTLHFSNKGSSDNMFVSLDYEVDHYILGMPQMLFLTVIIAIVCVLGVAAFVLLGRSH